MAKTIRIENIDNVHFYDSSKKLTSDEIENMSIEISEDEFANAAALYFQGKYEKLFDKILNSEDYQPCDWDKDKLAIYILKSILKEDADMSKTDQLILKTAISCLNDYVRKSYYNNW